MKTSELLAALSQECPNGVSFDPMAVRLLRQRVPFDDYQIQELKTKMVKLENGLWFSCEMISDDESRLAIHKKARAWLEEHGCFSVEQLFKRFKGDLRHLNTPVHFAAFLRHLGFTVSKWGKGLFCFNPPYTLGECLVDASKEVSERLEEAHGTLPFNEIMAAMPHLTAEVLEDILAQYLPNVHAAEVGGVSCWCSTESIHLPEDFSKQLTIIVDTLVELDEKVTASKLEFALNLIYRTRFRKEYVLLDNESFMRVCAKYYRGRIDFTNWKKSRVSPKASSLPGKRVRSPNTRFHNLRVPVGAKLVFTKNNHITCTVLDGVNQVEYDGKAWSISALAIHLLGVSYVNGFSYFSYEGEILSDRRLRLERADSHNK